MKVYCESTDCKFVKHGEFLGWFCSRQSIALNKQRKCRDYEKGVDRVSARAFLQMGGDE